VWIPKYRRKVLTGPVAEELERLVRKVCAEREVNRMPEPETILVCGRCGAQVIYHAARERGWVVARRARLEHELILLCPGCAKKGDADGGQGLREVSD
jgi:Ni,Fe-hydrogenase III small subunit